MGPTTSSFLAFSWLLTPWLFQRCCSLRFDTFCRLILDILPHWRRARSCICFVQFSCFLGENRLFFNQLRIRAASQLAVPNSVFEADSINSLVCVLLIAGSKLIPNFSQQTCKSDRVIYSLIIRSHDQEQSILPDQSNWGRMNVTSMIVITDAHSSTCRVFPSLL
jgi:hypothetical protein